MPRVGLVRGAFGVFLLGHSLCSVVFALPSGGSSILWCGIIVGGLGGYLGSQAGGGKAEGWGEMIYENTYRY